MKSTLLTALILFIAKCAYAQSIPLTGIVAIQNSQYETGKRTYVNDASVRAPFAKPITTDKDGTFTLRFDGLSSGSAVRLTVSSPGLTVVNKADLDHVVLGRVPLLSVVMVDEVHLAETQALYYGVASSSIDRTFQQRMARLRDERIVLAERIAAMDSSAERRIGSLGEAIETLTAQRDRALQQAQEIAFDLSAVDLDQASRRYVDAVEAFRNGDMDRVLDLLSAERLAAELNAAIDHKQRGEGLVVHANNAIRHVVEGLGLKAGVLMSALRYREAVPVQRAALDIIRQHPDAFGTGAEARSLREMGELMRTIGDYAASVVIFREALTSVSHVLPVDSLELTVLHSGLGRALAENGASEEALAETTFGLRMAMDLLGPAAPAIGDAAMARAQVHLLHNDYALSLADLEQALPILEATRTPDDVQVGQAHRLMGQCLAALDRYPEALVHLERAVNILPKTLGEAHPDVALTYFALGVALGAKGEVEKGTQALQHCLEIQLRTLGPDHPRLMRTYQRLANIRLYWSDPAGALVYDSLALAIGTKALDRDHPEMLILRHNTANALMESKQYAAALDEFRNCLQVQLRTIGPDHSDVASTYANMASDLERMGEKDSALFYFEKALELARRSLGPRTRIVSTDLIAVGRLELELGRTDRALDLFRESLSIRVEVLGTSSYVVANAHDYIGNAFFADHRLDSALVHYTEGFRIRTLVRPPGHEDLAKSLWRMGAVHYEQGDLELAKTELDSSFHIHPNAEAGWYLYRIAYDREEFAMALELLVPCARERVDDPATPVKQREETLVALKNLATRLDRRDILAQFELK